MLQIQQSFWCHKLPLLCLLSGNWRASFSRIGLNGEASSSLWISPTSMDGEKCRADFCGTCVWLTAPYHPKARPTEPTEQQKRFPDCIIDLIMARFLQRHSHGVNLINDSFLFSFHSPDAEVDKSNVNHFCGSRLWNSQALSASPRVLNENEFIVPGTGSQAYEGRRNLTDAQETAQWMAGTEIPERILTDLIGTSDFKNNRCL